MAKKRAPGKAARRKKKNASEASRSEASPSHPGCFAPGCHIALCGDEEWIEGCDGLQSFDDVSVANLPDMSVDPDSGLLSVINTSDTHARSFFITVYGRLLDKTGMPLSTGETRDSDGVVRVCTTLVLLVRPQAVMDVCYVAELEEDADGTPQLFSDIKDLTQEKYDALLKGLFESDTAGTVIGFPLRGGPFVCSQSFGGCFTHFYSGTFHAVDLLCDVGTPVVAVLPGKVIKVHTSSSVSGIDVRNLFLWNSITLECPTPDGCLYVEYVHIQQGSAIVSEGDEVSAGQELCKSGDVGFCPIPHLHIQVHASVEDGAPTIPFAFRYASGEVGVPCVGQKVC